MTLSPVVVTTLVFSGIIGLVYLSAKWFSRSARGDTEKEQQYSQLFKKMVEGVYFQSSDFRLIDVNSSALSMLGLSREQFLGHQSLPSRWQVVDEDGNTLQPDRYPAMEALRTGQRILNRVAGVFNPGRQEPVWLNVSAIPLFRDGENTPYQVFVTLHDISQRVQAQTLLRESENRLRTLINTIPDLVWLKDVRGRYLLCNQQFEKFFGESENDIVGRRDVDFVDEDLADFFRENDRKAMAADGPRVNEEWLTFAESGYHGLFETIKTPMRDEQGRLVGVLGIARDITQRTRAEKQRLHLENRLKQAQKMEAIGTLAGGIAHDFNNILSSILGFTELAMQDAGDNRLVQESLKEVYSAGIRAKELVSQILAFARQSDESKSPVELGKVVREVLRLIRSTTPTTIDLVQRISSVSCVNGNATRLQQVIMNLCTNAVHAMQDHGGVLEVMLDDVQLDGQGEGALQDLPGGDYVRLCVSDTGTGIPGDIIDSIFEPYFTTKELGEGTGMGLALVKGIVESYGGSIDVSSVVGSSTRFTVFLPVFQREAQEEQTESLKDEVGGHGRILLVDDEVQIVTMATRILERKGYEVVPVTGSLEAFTMFNREPSRFDLVVTDMTMPEMTGEQLAMELRKIRPDIPILILTGYSKVMDEKRAAELGINGFLYKPLSGPELVAEIRTILAGSQGERAIRD